MKNLFIVFLLSGWLVSCGGDDSSESEQAAGGDSGSQRTAEPQQDSSTGGSSPAASPATADTGTEQTPSKPLECQFVEDHLLLRQGAALSGSNVVVEGGDVPVSVRNILNENGQGWFERFGKLRDFDCREGDPVFSEGALFLSCSYDRTEKYGEWCSSVNRPDSTSTGGGDLSSSGECTVQVVYRGNIQNTQSPSPVRTGRHVTSSTKMTLSSWKHLGNLTVQVQFPEKVLDFSPCSQPEGEPESSDPALQESSPSA